MTTKRLRMNKCCSCQKLASFVLLRLFNFCLAACTTKAQLIAFKFSRREAGSWMQVCQTELCLFYLLFYSVLFCIICIDFLIYLSIYAYSNFSDFGNLPFFAPFCAQVLQSTQVFVCRCNKGWRRLFLYTTSRSTVGEFADQDFLFPRSKCITLCIILFLPHCIYLYIFKYSLLFIYLFCASNFKEFKIAASKGKHPLQNCIALVLLLNIREVLVGNGCLGQNALILTWRWTSGRG